VVPIFRDDEGRGAVERFINSWAPELKTAGIRHRVDWRDDRPGDKYAHWELKGVPLRLNVGVRDVEKGQVEVVDRLTRQREGVAVSGIGQYLSRRLDDFQKDLFERAAKFQSDNTFELATLDDVIAHFRERGGFVWTWWCGDADEEARVKADAGGVTIRTIDEESGGTRKCFVCGKPALYRVALAKAY
jgi:prolyl-tRNA synthetase